MALCLQNGWNCGFRRRPLSRAIRPFCSDLRRLGIQLVVDEVARGMGSLDGLARAPIWGLQLDRAWVTALREDAVALKVCRAGIGVAAALGMTPIATGVDDQAQRQALLALGCRYGMGDHLPRGGAGHNEAISRRCFRLAESRIAFAAGRRQFDRTII